MNTDFAFELRRPKPTTPWLLILCVAAAVFSGSWALYAWNQYSLAQAQAFRNESDKRQAATAQQLRNQTIAAAQQRTALAAADFKTLRSAALRWLALIETCHPKGAQMQSLALDTAHSTVTLEVMVATGADLEPWLFCLRRTSASKVEWQLREIRQELDPAGKARALVVLTGAR